MSKEIKKLKKANEKLLKANQKLKQKFDSLKKNIKDKGIRELLKLQKKEDDFQDREERNSKVDYVRYEGSAEIHSKRIPEVEAMNLDLLTYESSLEDRQKALVERQASKRKVLHSCKSCDGCSDSIRAECATDNNLDPFVAQIAERPKKRQKTDDN